MAAGGGGRDGGGVASALASDDKAVRFCVWDAMVDGKNTVEEVRNWAARDANRVVEELVLTDWNGEEEVLAVTLRSKADYVRTELHGKQVVVLAFAGVQADKRHGKLGVFL